VAKTFTLAIDEAAKLHPAAEPLIVHAAFLAPEPIPHILFLEAREKFGEPLCSALEGDGLDEVVAALRASRAVDALRAEKAGGTAKKVRCEMVPGFCFLRQLEKRILSP
jgi:hypothetical protein